MSFGAQHACSFTVPRADHSHAHDQPVQSVYSRIPVCHGIQESFPWELLSLLAPLLLSEGHEKWLP